MNNVIKKKKRKEHLIACNITQTRNSGKKIIVYFIIKILANKIARKLIQLKQGLIRGSAP